MTPGQQEALRELAYLAETGGALEMLGDPTFTSVDAEVKIRVSMKGVRSYPGGLQVHATEDLEVWIPKLFPLEHPTLLASDLRFASRPHVYGRLICLYIDPATQWSPSDGMFGFLHRVGEWFSDAAEGRLDPDNGPIHPPIGSGIGYSSTQLVVKAEVPPSKWPRLIWANLDERTGQRVDVTRFHRFKDRATPRIAAVLVTNQQIQSNYGGTFALLATQLAQLGFSGGSFGRHLIDVAALNVAGTPLIVIVATLNRGTASNRQHHLVAWELPAELANHLRTFAGGDHSELQTAADKLTEWAADTPLEWVRLHDARPSVTIRRDHSTPMQALAGKRIEIWGCGALGGWLAEFVARAAPEKLILRDRGVVSPGLIVRQPYIEQDVTDAKVTALKRRIEAIDPTIEVVTSPRRISDPANISLAAADIDLVIDATANRTVAAALEVAIGSSQDTPFVASVLTDANAQLGALFMSPPDGAGPRYTSRQTLKRLKDDPGSKHFLDAFWPAADTADLVHPDPGCSAPTFHGSAADVATIAGTLITLIATAFRDQHGHAAELVAMHGADLPPSAKHQARHTALAPIQIPGDDGYRVILTHDAATSITDLAHATFETAAPGQVEETGGTLIGERDAATKTVTVDTALGPAPDSSAGPSGFVRGIQGVADEIEVHQETSALLRSVYLGDWHTHPSGAPKLSLVDEAAALKMADQGAGLLLIWAGTPDKHDWAARVLDPVLRPPVDCDVSTVSPPDEPTQALMPKPNQRRAVEPSTWRRCEAAMPPRRALDPMRSGRRPIGVALSGGGFRATLAALGTLRFLADADLLSDVRLISSVSGGSIANAATAINWSEAQAQPNFDRVVLAPILDQISRRSFTNELVRNSWRSVAPGHSRTTVLAERLDRRLFDGALLEDLPSGCWFTFNSTTEREGVRFRFDADVVGDYVNGSVSTSGTNLRVATAVAASAAVPGLFPPLRMNGLDLPCQSTQGVSLVDGGVYDNLGLEAIMRRRPELADTFMISLNAGAILDQGPRRGINRLPIAGSLWRANKVMHRQSAALRTRQLFDEINSDSPRSGVVFNLASNFDSARLEGQLAARLARWRALNAEHDGTSITALSTIPTTFARIDEATAVAIIQRAWWLCGATLSVYHPGLVPSLPSWTPINR